MDDEVSKAQSNHQSNLLGNKAEAVRVDTEPRQDCHSTLNPLTTYFKFTTQPHFRLFQSFDTG
jgi:hypothetical protein